MRDNLLKTRRIDKLTSANDRTTCACTPTISFALSPFIPIFLPPPPSPFVLPFLFWCVVVCCLFTVGVPPKRSVTHTHAFVFHSALLSSAPSVTHLLSHSVLCSLPSLLFFLSLSSSGFLHLTSHINFLLCEAPPA